MPNFIIILAFLIALKIFKNYAHRTDLDNLPEFQNWLSYGGSAGRVPQNHLENLV